jgi:hypothetical protein
LLGFAAVIRTIAALALALACVVPATAAALPGDPPVQSLAPADGATASIDPDGIPVSFTCPVYRSYDAGAGFIVYGGPKDYGASFSKSPALGPDGRLTDPAALDQASETPPTGSARCTAVLAAGGAERPQEAPGKYYWQPWRICTGCALGYEVGPVRSLTLRANASAKLRPPKRAWAGYPFALAIAVPGAGDGTPVRVQRKAGRKWKRLASTEAIGERAEAVLTLKRGRHTLRAVATIGDQAVTSPAKKVTVARASHWTTSRADDGAYRGRKPTVRLKVAGGGRRIKSFSARIAMLCPGVLPGQFTTQIGTAALRKVKIAPDGSFLAAATPDRSTSILVRGRLHHGRVTKGRVQLSVGPCSGSNRFTAHR